MSARVRHGCNREDRRGRGLLRIPSHHRIAGYVLFRFLPEQLRIRSPDVICVNFHGILGRTGFEFAPGQVRDRAGEGDLLREWFDSRRQASFPHFELGHDLLLHQVELCVITPP